MFLFSSISSLFPPLLFLFFFLLLLSVCDTDCVTYTADIYVCLTFLYFIKTNQQLFFKMLKKDTFERNFLSVLFGNNVHIAAPVS